MLVRVIQKISDHFVFMINRSIGHRNGLRNQDSDTLYASKIDGALNTRIFFSEMHVKIGPLPVMTNAPRCANAAFTEPRIESPRRLWNLLSKSLSDKAPRSSQSLSRNVTSQLSYSATMFTQGWWLRGVVTQ